MRNCRTGWDALCLAQHNSGYSVNGSFAEYAIGSAAYVGRLPPNPDFVAMAPILCAGVTTYKGIKETEVRPGEWIAISGVGGLGQLGIQYAKAMGMHVAALDVTEEKLALARASGADVTVNAKEPDAAAQIVKQTGGGAHGALVTAVSPAAFAQAIHVVRRKGTVTLVGLPPASSRRPSSRSFWAGSPSWLDRGRPSGPRGSNCVRCGREGPFAHPQDEARGHQRSVRQHESRQNRRPHGDDLLSVRPGGKRVLRVVVA